MGVVVQVQLDFFWFSALLCFNCDGTIPSIGSKGKEVDGGSLSK